MSVENLWLGHFKEHRLVQEMIEDKVFYLYCTDFCAAATEALDRAVTVTVSGGLAGGSSLRNPQHFYMLGWTQRSRCRFVKRLQAEWSFRTLAFMHG